MPERSEETNPRPQRILTSPEVSARMKANRSRDTGPELRLRKALHQAGYRYRIDFGVPVIGRGPIKVDVAFTRRRVAVFVDGCFWHGCHEHRTIPTSNVEYWKPKLERNAERDREVSALLEAAGWFVIRVWEHEDVESAVKKIGAYLESAGRNVAVLKQNLLEAVRGTSPG